jgi:hypothetical protein
MRLALFSLINFLVAGGFGLRAYLGGQGLSQIVLTVVIVLVVLQLAYALWLVAISYMKPTPEVKDETADADTVVRSGGRRLSGAPGGPGNHGN